MLSPIRTPEGAPLNCDYVCPAALCENWQEQRVKRNINRFQPCPKKFAHMCKQDAKRAHAALVDYENKWGRANTANHMTARSLELMCSITVGHLLIRRRCLNGQGQSVSLEERRSAIPQVSLDDGTMEEEEIPIPREDGLSLRMIVNEQL